MDWNSNMMQMMRPYSAASDFVEKMQRLRSNSTYLVVVVSLSFFTVSQKSEWILWKPYFFRSECLSVTGFTRVWCGKSGHVSKEEMKASISQAHSMSPLRSFLSYLLRSLHEQAWNQVMVSPMTLISKRSHKIPSAHEGHLRIIKEKEY